MKKMIEIRHDDVLDEFKVSCPFPLGNDFAEKVRELDDVKSAFLFDESTLNMSPLIFDDEDETGLWANIFALIAKRSGDSIDKLSVDGGNRPTESQVTVAVNVAKQLLAKELLAEYRVAVEDFLQYIDDANYLIDRCNPNYPAAFSFEFNQAMSELDRLAIAQEEAKVALQAAVNRL